MWSTCLLIAFTCCQIVDLSVATGVPCAYTTTVGFETTHAKFAEFQQQRQQVGQADGIPRLKAPCVLRCWALSLFHQSPMVRVSGWEQEDKHCGFCHWRGRWDRRRRRGCGGVCLRRSGRDNCQRRQCRLWRLGGRRWLLWGRW